MKVSFISYKTKAGHFRAQDLCAHLQEKGYEVVFEETRGADWYIILSPLSLDLVDLAARLHREGKRVIFDNYYSYVESALEGCLAPGSVRERLLRWVERQMFAMANHVLVDSEGSRGFYMDLYGVPGDRITAVYAVCGSPQFGPRPPSEAVRQRLGLGEVTLCYHGAFLGTHRVDVMIRAFRDLLAEYPEATFILIGDGERQVKLMNDRPDRRIKFLGRVPYEDAPDYLSCATVWLGAFGNSGKANRTARTGMFDAMALGLTVVTGDTDENRRVIRDGDNGHLVSPEDPEALHRKLKHVLDGKLFTGRRGRESLAGRFDVPTMGARLEAILNDTVHTNPTRIRLSVPVRSMLAGVRIGQALGVRPRRWG